MPIRDAAASSPPLSTRPLLQAAPRAGRRRRRAPLVYAASTATATPSSGARATAAAVGAAPADDDDDAAAEVAVRVLVCETVLVPVAPAPALRVTVVDADAVVVVVAVELGVRACDSVMVVLSDRCWASAPASMPRAASACAGFMASVCLVVACEARGSTARPSLAGARGSDQAPLLGEAGEEDMRRV